MNNVKVSVIIPVYNSEKYLEQCLDSAVHQSLNEIEILCIDDGSSDSSPEILERYQNQDRRIKVLTQMNSGPAAARNNGSNNAAGEYIAFLDSDDFLQPDALEKLYAKAIGDEADICAFGVKYFSEEYKEIIQYDVMPDKRGILQELPFSISDAFDYILNFTTNSIWNKIYRRDFLNEHELRFPDMKRGEDLCFVHEALCLAERITVVKEALINYRFYRNDSLTSTLYEKPEDFVDAWLFSADRLKRNDVYPERSFLNNVLGSMVWLFRSIRLSWTAFESVYYRLKNGDLQKLGLSPREPGYYYVSWHEEILNNMYKQDAQDFLMSFIFIMEIRNRKLTASKDAQKQKYQEKQDKNAQLIRQQKDEIKQQKNEIRELEKENKRIKREYDKLIASGSYRIGRMITWLPRMIRKLIRGSRNCKN